MTVRPTLAKIVKGTMVAVAFVLGSALVAPGFASAEPVSRNTVSASGELKPIQAPAPVRGAWWCDWWLSDDGTTMAFDCSVAAGTTIGVVIYCSNGNVAAQGPMTGPGRWQFYLTCGPNAFVTDYRGGVLR